MRTPRMSTLKIKEFYIKGKRIEQCSGDIYRKIGLNVTTKKDRLQIKSSKSAKIKTIHNHIHVHIYDINTVKTLMEEGFCKESETEKNMPLEMVDELGNKILATFIPKSKIRKIAVLTSGGDAPGMNGAIRAIVRTGRKWGSDVFGVYNGYEGLINDNIEELTWDSVGSHSTHGGTFLLSARSKSFLSTEGRKTATYNLAKRGIDGLIIIGGDGSLNGSMVFKNEFQTHLQALIEEGKLDKNSKKLDLKVIAIPASIDNDISNADMTLGADSALTRVIECVNSLVTTMISHKRSFVIEVMGRNCGWIALMSSLAIGADYVFIPEAPHTTWEKDMIESINFSRSKGKFGSFIVIAEGATNCEGKKIDPSDVRKLIEQELKVECRVITLGHIQRGGRPSAFDRIMSTFLGCKAVEHMLCDLEATPIVITLKDGKYTSIPLEKIIQDNENMTNLQKSGNFERILYQRGLLFSRAYKLSEQLRTGLQTCKRKGKLAVVHEGARAGGMNAALHTIVRYGISLNQDVFVIQDGFNGLLLDQITKARTFQYVSGLFNGGSIIGSSYSTNIESEKIYEKLKEHEITSLIVIGGPESLEIVKQIKHVIKEKNDFRSNIVLIPATVDNDIPNTDMCLGADTALNCLMLGCDVLRLSSLAMKQTVFVVEVPGDMSGYIALLGGIAAEAFEVFIPERKYMITHLSETAQRLKYRFKKGNRHGILLIKNEKTFMGVSIDAFSKIITTDSDGLYDAKYSVFGYFVEGGTPSPYDRICATVLGIKAVDILLNTDSENIYDQGDAGIFGVIGLRGQKIRFSEIEEVLNKYRRIQNKEEKPRWSEYANICRSME